MENLERVYELLEAIEKAYLTELRPLDIREDVLSILEENIICSLQDILNKIKFYSQKAQEDINK